MELIKILKYLDKKFPEKSAADWDKSGIQLFDSHLKINPSQDIQRIFITLDLTDTALEEALKFRSDLIITRHPFIFSELKSEKSNPSKKAMIKKLMKQGIVIYSIHTNYDNSVHNNLINLIDSQLPVKKTQKFGDYKEGLFIKLKQPISSQKFSDQLKVIFPGQVFSVTSNWLRQPLIKEFHLVPGAGGSTMINSGLHSTILVTGELKWHEWLYALDNNVQVLTLGHEMENHFSNHLKDVLKNAHQDLKITTYYQKSPFELVKEEN